MRLTVGVREFSNERKRGSWKVGKSEFPKGGDVMSGVKHSSHPQIRARARVRAKAQLTLPEEIRRALGVDEGDDVEFAVQEDGTITVRGYVSIPTDQALSTADV